MPWGKRGRRLWGQEGEEVVGARLWTIMAESALVSAQILQSGCLHENGVGLPLLRL